MRLQKRGASISKTEVLNISKSGLWVYVEPKEYFLSYRDFPWFKNAKVSAVCNVQLVHGRHLRWEDLDIDLELKSLKHLEQYPLKYA